MISEKLKKKIEQGREYRSLQMDAEDDKEFQVRGYATTFDQEYLLYRLNDGREVREKVINSAFDDTDMDDVIFQYDHEGRVFARISNQTLRLDKDEHGLLVDAYLGGTETGKSLYEEIKGGYTNKMSFGFTVDDDSVEETPYGYLRTIKAIGKLYDVSAVSLPANDYTEISARSHCDGAIAEIEAERLRLEEERRLLAEQKESLLNRIKTLKGDPNGN